MYTHRYEPLDSNLSSPLSADTFEEFLQAHELSVVNFFAPWCIWCRRFEPVYLKAASEIPDLHFHGHARLAQVRHHRQPSLHAIPPFLCTRMMMMDDDEDDDDDDDGRWTAWPTRPFARRT